jgi:hypothetical protein
MVAQVLDKDFVLPIGKAKVGHTGSARVARLPLPRTRQPHTIFHTHPSSLAA